MQKNIKHILVPVNFSEASANTLQTAIAICKRHQAVLHLVNIFETELLLSTAGMQVPAAGIAAELSISRQDNLQRLSASISRNHGIACQHHFETGFIPYIICAKAEELCCDMIVVGTKVSSKIRKALYGSNIISILKNATVPVLTVPSKKHVLDFKKILFPVRSTLNIAARYKTAKAIMKKNNAEVLVMGVVNKQQGIDLAAINSLMHEAVLQMGSDDINASSELHFSKNDAEEIVNKGKVNNFDLVVISATLKRNLKQFFLPGYVQKLINNSFIPVLFIKPATTTNTLNGLPVKGSMAMS